MALRETEKMPVRQLVHFWDGGGGFKRSDFQTLYVDAFVLNIGRNLCSSVDIVSEYGLAVRGFQSRHGEIFFYSPKTSSSALVPTLPPISLATGGKGDVDSSSPFSDEIMNNRSYTSTPCRCLHDMDKDDSIFVFSYFQ